ncbi:AAA ATPase-like domain-containing protein, nuclease domain-containing [Candidatus Magnetomoraceae bacterium gMMP-15]
MQTKRKLPIGISNFKKLRDNNFHYIDKSMFIKEVIEASAEVLLFPRPRRFGKTLNLSMLRYFFEKSNEDKSNLFNGLKIYDDEFFKKHQGQYPVIYLTFKDIKALSWENSYEGIREIISEEVERHNELLNWDGLSDRVKTRLKSIINGNASQRIYENSLLILSKELHRCHGAPVVILIDEYDTPLHSAYINNYYDEVISFIRNFLGCGLKDNEHLFKGVITGILRVAKESVFSGLNNLGVYSLLVPEFAQIFGFTEKETKKLLSDFDIEKQYDEVAYWYNGYLFGGEVIYNPWSLLNYAASKDKKPRPYWLNTADTSMIDKLATRGGRELREELGCLLDRDVITKPIYESIVMKDLEKRDNLLWSFLLFSGYLKTVEQIDNEMFKLQIPNNEVSMIYRKLIQNWFDEKIESNQLEEMLRALEIGDIKLFQRMLRLIVKQIMSYHDLSGQPEKVYHALVLGMLVWLSYKYEIRSNRESGYGRYDIMLKPKDLNKQGIIIEFKRVYKDEGETPEGTLEDALKQIEEKQYAAELEAAGVNNILKLAIAFQGKELWIREG